MIRDAFINGISSPEIRQRLLEHKVLSMDDAYNQAVTLDDAKKDNLAFGNNSGLGSETVVYTNAVHK